MSDDAPKMVIQPTMWEANEYVVSIRPEDEKPWMDRPLGYTLNKNNATIIAAWLQSAWPVLYRIAANMARDEAE